MQDMITELTRLMFGILLLGFHRQVADFIVYHERILVGLLRERGLTFPAAPTTETARNIYFGIGMFVVLYEFARIWLILHGKLI
jgi:hypothetical protein